MKRSMLMLMMVVMVCLLSCLFPQLAEGMALLGNGTSFPLVCQKVVVTIDNQVAVTRLDQTFVNTGDTVVEATYRFPLGERASVQEFGLTGPSGQRHIGSIEEKHEAQNIYQNAQAQGVIPAIAQSVDPNSFETKIGNVAPKGKSVVDLTYSEILSYKNGTVTYSIPLNVKALQTHDLELLSVTINLKDQKEIVNVTSPSHPISARKIDAHNWQITFEKTGFCPDIDFSLAYEVKAERMGLNFLSTQPVAGEDGYFMMLLAPQEVVDAADIAAKDIVFVMDTSGSMQGYKIEQTKAAFNFFVSHLNANDRFEVIAFSDRIQPWRGALVAASEEAKRGGAEFLTGLYAGGSTNIDEALSRARGVFTNEPNRTKAIIFLTDGQPTAGITNVNAICSNMKTGNTARIRTFVFGVGEDVSTQLLDKIALENRGESLYVRQNENIEARLTGFFETISKPLLVDLNIDWNGMSVSEQYPRQLPNVYKGSQVVLSGRYSGSGHKVITVSGDLNGQMLKFPIEVNFVKDSQENRFVARTWAKSKADSLIQEMSAYGEDPNKKNEVIRLSKAFQFVTPFTSFIAVAPEKVAPSKDLDAYRNQVSMNNGNYQSAPVSAMAITPSFNSINAVPAGSPITVIQTTEAKPLSLWGAYGFFPAAALLVPNFKKAREQARGKSCMANMRVILGAIEMYQMDHSTPIPLNIVVPDILMTAGYLKQMPQCPCVGGGYDYVVNPNSKTGATPDPWDGVVRCRLHNTVDNPYFGQKTLSNGQPVIVKNVTPWHIELWNQVAGPAVELLINIPLLLIGLYFTWLLFIRPLFLLGTGVLETLSWLCGYHRS